MRVLAKQTGDLVAANMRAIEEQADSWARARLDVSVDAIPSDCDNRQPVFRLGWQLRDRSG